MSFLKKLFGGSDSADADWVGLNGRDLTYEGDHGGVRVWRLPEGDAVGLYFFAVEPDLPRGHVTVSKFVEAYRSHVESAGAMLVEAEVTTKDNVSMLRTIVKVPQRPHGLTFLGSFIIPFRDFSFVAKVQCEEHGMTGVRESVLLDQALANGVITLDEGELRGDFDPDSPHYDAQFPDHPVSRARRHLERIETSLWLSSNLGSREPFGLPA